MGGGAGSAEEGHRDPERMAPTIRIPIGMPVAKWCPRINYTAFVTPATATTSSVTSFTLVRIAYERRKDCPAQPSILMWVSLTVDSSGRAVELFLEYLNDVDVPRTQSHLKEAADREIYCARFLRHDTGCPLELDVVHRDATTDLIANLDGAARQGGSARPVTDPGTVALTKYSREDNAVVSGFTATCDLLWAPTVKVHPSGVVWMPWRRGCDGAAFRRWRFREVNRQWLDWLTGGGPISGSAMALALEGL